MYSPGKKNFVRVMYVMSWRQYKRIEALQPPCRNRRKKKRFCDWMFMYIFQCHTFQNGKIQIMNQTPAVQNWSSTITADVWGRHILWIPENSIGIAGNSWYKKKKWRTVWSEHRTYIGTVYNFSFTDTQQSNKNVLFISDSSNTFGPDTWNGHNPRIKKNG
jgi:hypothetical protein